MDKKITYHEQTTRDNTIKLRNVLSTLPGFTKDYFRAIEPNTSAKTRISYVYDVRLFFRFLCETNPYFKRMADITEIRLADLELLQPVDIEEYLEWLKYYRDEDGVEHTNNERGLHRKLAALRSFFSYYYKREMIKNNPTVIVDMPKLHKREITRLDADEVAELLDYVEHGGDEMTGMKKVYFEKNKARNLALSTLLLGTGIRVSECVGLDLERKILYILEMKSVRHYMTIMRSEKRSQRRKDMNMPFSYPSRSAVSASRRWKTLCRTVQSM